MFVYVSAIHLVNKVVCVNVGLASPDPLEELEPLPKPRSWFEAVVRVARSSRGVHGTEASMGWGIWRILCIK